MAVTLLILIISTGLQGAFLDAEAVNKTSSNLSADDLLELLNTDQTKGDKAQSGVVSDKVDYLLQQYWLLQYFAGPCQH